MADGFMFMDSDTFTGGFLENANHFPAGCGIFRHGGVLADQLAWPVLFPSVSRHQTGGPTEMLPG
jgi:hypothetical protein